MTNDPHFQEHRLNARQERFVEAYTSGTSATEAAKRAGYEPSNAAVQGSQLLRKSYVQEAVQRRLPAAMVAAGLSTEDAYRALKHSIEDEHPKVRAPRVRAAEIVLRVSGDLRPDTSASVDARTVLFPGGIGASVAELEAMLEKLTKGETG